MKTNRYLLIIVAFILQIRIISADETVGVGESDNSSNTVSETIESSAKSQAQIFIDNEYDIYYSRKAKRPDKDEKNKTVFYPGELKV